jgi:hypothetical protein
LCTDDPFVPLLTEVSSLPIINWYTLYYLLSLLAGEIPWTQFQPRKHGFAFTPLVWTLRLGARGLALGWESAGVFSDRDATENIL